MRRLPVYFLIDVSESMVGDPIQQVEEGLAGIIQSLKADPYAIETVWVSIIVFAGQAKTLVPLQEIIHFYPPRFPVGGGTALSKGLGHLMYELRKNIVKTTYERKGDWKPIIFLFTDGVPTDDTAHVIQEWKENWQRSANLVAISFGDEADSGLLKELTEHVLLFRNTEPGAYQQFFKWVTDSIKTSSEKIEGGGAGMELTKIDGDTLSQIDISKAPAAKTYTDPNFVVLSARCQNTHRPYLMKYRKTLSSSRVEGLDLATREYRLVGAFPVDKSYAELTDESEGTAVTIHSDELVGGPTCPCCGNQIGFAMCSCGKLHCIGTAEKSTCPWCGVTGTYGIGEGGFDVTRTQG